MELTNQYILLASALVLISIFASLLSPRLGAPLLLVFLVIGMLAGEDGPGGIQFQDVEFAYLIGTVALAIILFDGGLRTEIGKFRVGLRPALSLATLGVLLTTVVIGLVAAWLLDLPWVEGLLLGAIVGSTDAAAVFSVLGSRGVALKERVVSTLEIESGINDPMAVFLTVVLIEMLLLPEAQYGWHVVLQFIWQMGAGGLLGVAGGRLLAWTVSRLQFSPGLVPLVSLFGGLGVFGLAGVLGTSGYLAVYLAGLMVGEYATRGVGSMRRFHDGMAWLAQISMFLILGLLVTPTALLPYAGSALLIGLVIMFIARPLAVWLCLLPFRFDWREFLFVSWVGLRGSVPIILAMFPWLAGLDDWPLFFNVAFVIVLLSLTLQGWTVAPLARLLGLEIPTGSTRIQRLEMELPGQSQAEIVTYRLAEDSPVLGIAAVEVPMPFRARIFAIGRGGRLLRTSRAGELRADDYVYVLAASLLDARELDRCFMGSDMNIPESQAYFGEFVLNPDADLAEVAAVYGFMPPGDAGHRESLESWFLRHFPSPVVGDRLRLDGVQLVVRAIQNGRIARIGLKLSRG